ncbi:MAG: hypothetical protein QM791_01315 [Ferruginibacter sp.]
MGLFERYLNGETESVYEDIYKLESEAFNSGVFPEVESVLIETFRRVRFNLEIIYKELLLEDYLFTSPVEFDWQKPLTDPDPGTEELLLEIKDKLGKNGDIPISLQYFYRQIGSCNFCWDYKMNDDIPWECADPVDIPPLRNLIEIIDEYGTDYEFGEEGILIAGDYYTKDNISGSAYSIQITNGKKVDSLLIHKEWNIPFINYLRITFQNCGFSRADRLEYESLNSFCERIRPKLKQI